MRTSNPGMIRALLKDAITIALIIVTCYALLVIGYGYGG